jgi:hypothetical protein
MIPPTATTLQLSTDDIAEYESHKRLWPKLKKEPKKNMTEAEKREMHKREVHDRIGLNPTTK